MVDEQNNEDDGREPDAQRDSGGGPGGPGEPEGLPGGRIPAPPIPRDEWVGNVIDDPASNEQPVLLQGYVGDAAEEGYTRIYPSASLDTFVDVRNEDVLYHQPLDGDHAPRGGSMVWIRGNTQLSRGTAPAAGADFFTGPVLAQNRQAGTVVGPTGWQGCGQPQISLPGCIRTGVCISLPGCVQTGACQPGAEAGGPIGPTGYQGCGQPSHLIGCTGYQGCGQPHISLPGCIQTGSCQPGGAGGPIGPTGYQGCGQPSHLIGCTGYQGCGQPHISLPGCVQTGSCGTGPAGLKAAAGPIGPTGYQGCGQPSHLIGCTGYQGCGQPHISLPGCIQTGSCQPGAETGGPIGPTGYQGCGQPSHLIGCTGYQGCGQPHISLPGCIQTGSCPQAEAVTGPGSTIATVCTQIGCPHTGVANCSIATVCTQVGCHTAPQHCIPSFSGCPNTTSTICTQIGCPVGGAGGPIGPTGYQGCGQPHISLPGCIHTGTCPPQGAGGGQGPIGVTGWQGCGQGPIGVTGWQGCGQPHVSLPGCIHTGTCPPQGAGGGQGPIGVTGWHGCGQGPIGVTGWQGCGQPHISLPGCIHTGTCPQGGAGGGLQGAVTGPDSTIATVCTQFGCRHTGLGCPRTSTCPPTFTPGCGPETEHGGSTAATLCTQVPFCPVTGHCPPRGAGAMLGAAGLPTGQYSPACPTFGFTCTVFC